MRQVICLIATNDVLGVCFLFVAITGATHVVVLSRRPVPKLGLVFAEHDACVRQAVKWLQLEAIKPSHQRPHRDRTVFGQLTVHFVVSQVELDHHRTELDQAILFDSFALYAIDHERFIFVDGLPSRKEAGYVLDFVRLEVDPRQPATLVVWVRISGSREQSGNSQAATTP